jgi:hypothetical protein
MAREPIESSLNSNEGEGSCNEPTAMQNNQPDESRRRWTTCHECYQAVESH